MDNVHSPGFVGAGESIHLNLGGRRAAGKVFEGLSLHERRIPMKPFGAVVAGSPQLYSLQIGFHDNFCERETTVADA